MTTPVVTVFVRHEGDVCLFERSDAVGTYAGRWGAVSGHVATDDAADPAPDRDPLDAARAELAEEAGVTDATLVRDGDPFTFTDDAVETTWRVHPFLFEVPDRHVETNEETTRVDWVAPPAILRRETVPNLWTSYDRVRPRVATVAEDREHGSTTLSYRALEVLRDEATLAVEGRAVHAADAAEGVSDRLTHDERTGNDWDALADLARALRGARPSMAVVANRVNRAMAEAREVASPAAVEVAAGYGLARAIRADLDAANTAAARLPERVATLSRSGTVLAALERAAPSSVLVAESRPGGEGVGVAETLAASLDCDVTLTTDAAFPAEVAARDVEAIVVGVDRILSDGAVVNKVGTRAALLAAPADCETLVVAATDKVATDDVVDREARPATEVYAGDAPVSVANPTFDVTPADAVDAICTEDGRLAPDDVSSVADAHRERARWDGENGKPS